MARSIAVVNEKGGVGKTAAVSELAYALGSQGHTVLVVDLDSQANASRLLLGRMGESQDDEPNAFHLLTQSPKLSEVWRPATDAWPNTMVIPGGVLLTGLEAALPRHMPGTFQKLKQTLAPAQKAFDYVLLDLPPALSLITTMALTASDCYLCPTDGGAHGQKGLQQIHQIADQLKASGFNKRLACAGVFVTMFGKANARAMKAALRDLETEYGDQLLAERIPHTVKAREAERAGQPVGAYAPKSPIAAAYRALAAHFKEG
jgi:chromosome partitioning protein